MSGGLRGYTIMAKWYNRPPLALLLSCHMFTPLTGIIDL